MKCRSYAASSVGPNRRGRTWQAAFTLIEVLAAVGVLGILAGSSIWTLTQMNKYASVSRLYTGAEAVAQNRIDEILSEAPFNPQNSPPEVPAALTLGTSAPVEVRIYDEPSALGSKLVVKGELVTTITKSTTPGPGGVDLNLYSATVVVIYPKQEPGDPPPNKTYRVQLNAMRASDV